METYKRVLRQVGTLWIVLSLMDIIRFAYRTANGSDHPSYWTVSIGITLIGIFLFKGSLKVAYWMGTGAAFFLVIICMLTFTSLLVKPPGLWMVELEQYPIQLATSLFFQLCTIAILVWTHKQLRSRTVLRAYAATGMDTRFPKTMFSLVIIIMISLSFWMYSILTGEDAIEAKRLANGQLGDQYTYHVSGMRWSGDRVSANVIAYSQNEIRFTTVNWSKNTSK